MQALAAAGAGVVWTGARDGAARRWAAGGGGPPACDAALLGHAGWVSGLGLLDEGRLVATASSDGAVRLWGADEGEAGGSGQLARAVLGGHADAVTCLACPPQGRVPSVVSAGLRGEWFVWDAARSCRGAGEGGGVQDGGGGGAPVASGRGPSSFYSVAADPEGALICTGDSSGVVRLWDPRASPGCVAALKGHGDTVRALAFDGEAGTGDRKVLVSGASDRTLKVWDLGQQRCVRTLTVHSDSVWALELDGRGRAYSGGRDGCLYRTNLASRSSELLARADGPVQALALCPEGEGVWVATLGSSSVTRWDMPPGDAGAAAVGGRAGGGAPRPASPRTPTTGQGGLGGGIGGGGDGRDGGGGASAFTPSTSPLTAGARRLSRGRGRSGSSRFHDPERLMPLLGVDPGIVIAGGPSVSRFEVLNCRRRILCLASDGYLHIFDVCRMAWAESLGPCGGEGGRFEAMLEDLQPQVSVPAWFTAECRMGVLAIRLEPPQCFACEAYLTEFVETSNDEAKLNMGQQLLRAALAPCVERGGLGDSPPRWKAPLEAPTFTFRTGGDCLAAEGGREGRDSGLGGAFGTSHHGLALISVSASGEPWRKNLEDFTGEDLRSGMLPAWAVEALSPPHAPAGPQGKLGFLLQPAEGSDLPALLQGRLTAPRILPVKKIKVFATNKLVEALKAGSSAGEDAARLEAKDIELLCCGGLLGDLETLASVRAFVWKKSSDIVIEYRRRVQ